jgi:hypothetical protein
MVDMGIGKDGMHKYFLVPCAKELKNEVWVDFIFYRIWLETEFQRNSSFDFPLHHSYESKE